MPGGYTGVKILFVENHLVFARTVTEKFLGGHEVTIVATIGAAIATLARTAFDVVLVDYDVDDDKGTELVRHARDTGFFGRILGTSAHERGNERLLEAGADAVCGKMEFARIRDLLVVLPSC